MAKVVAAIIIFILPHPIAFQNPRKPYLGSVILASSITGRPMISGEKSLPDSRKNIERSLVPFSQQ